MMEPLCIGRVLEDKDRSTNDIQFLGRMRTELEKEYLQLLPVATELTILRAKGVFVTTWGHRSSADHGTVRTREIELLSNT